MSRGKDPYEVVLSPAAARALRKLPRKDSERILVKVMGLASNPRPNGVEKLTDRGDRYRVRSGDFRIVFSIDDDGKVVDVETIGHRRDIYKE